MSEDSDDELIDLLAEEASKDIEESKGDSLSNKSSIADIFHSLSKPEKLEIFILLSEGKSPTEIIDQVSVSDSTVHNYVNEFIDSGILEKDNLGYHVTFRGNLMLEAIRLLDFLSQFELLKIIEMPINKEDVKEILQSNLDNEYQFDFKFLQKMIGPDSTFDECVVCGELVEVNPYGNNCANCGATIHDSCIFDEDVEVDSDTEDGFVQQCPACASEQ